MDSKRPYYYVSGDSDHTRSRYYTISDLDEAIATCKEVFYSTLCGDGAAYVLYVDPCRPHEDAETVYTITHSPETRLRLCVGDNTAAHRKRLETEEVYSV